MCGNDLANMLPILESTNEGTVFQFDATFTSTSSDGNATSTGFSLSIICEYCSYLTGIYSKIESIMF